MDTLDAILGKGMRKFSSGYVSLPRENVLDDKRKIIIGFPRGNWYFTFYSMDPFDDERCVYRMDTADTYFGGGPNRAKI